jgi:very-short-patch-repair endonuclease
VTLAERGKRFNETPDGRVRQTAERQHALIRHDQAVAVGMGDDAIGRRVASGLWSAILPRVYLVHGGSATGRQAAMAAALWAGDDAVVSHRTAGVLWGLDGVDTTRVEVTVSHRRAPRNALVTVHRSHALPAADRDAIHGIPVTSPARTIVDLSAVMSGEALISTLESALRLRLTTQSFVEWRLRELGGKGRKGAAQLRRILDERGRGAAALESRLEVKLARLLTASPLPAPVRQFWLDLHGDRYRVDFAWPDRKVALEADGYETHGGRASFERDHRRLTALAAAGWRVLPVTWAQVTRSPSMVLTEVARALETFH